MTMAQQAHKLIPPQWHLQPARSISV